MIALSFALIILVLLFLYLHQHFLFYQIFAGTGSTPRTSGLETVAGFELAHVLTAESFLMCRYVRSDAG